MRTKLILLVLGGLLAVACRTPTSPETPPPEAPPAPQAASGGEQAQVRW